MPFIGGERPRDGVRREKFISETQQKQSPAVIQKGIRTEVGCGRDKDKNVANRVR